MKRSIVYAGAGAIVALIALGAWQHFRRPPFGLPPEVRLERRLGRLGLDRAQREKVEVILTAARKGRVERRTQLRQAGAKRGARMLGDPRIGRMVAQSSRRSA